MIVRRLASVVAVVAVAGCGSQSSSSTIVLKRAEGGRAYQLYTHCGIEWARINGTFWRAKQPLSDGSGNPPPGWGNPFQAGRIVFVSQTTARFDSAAGTVTFVRTSRRQPPMICS